MTTATESAALPPERSGLFGCFLPYGTVSSADSENSASISVPFWTYISLIYSIIRRLNMQNYVHSLKFKPKMYHIHQITIKILKVEMQVGEIETHSL